MDMEMKELIRGFVNNNHYAEFWKGIQGGIAKTRKTEIARAIRYHTANEKEEEA